MGQALVAEPFDDDLESFLVDVAPIVEWYAMLGEFEGRHSGADTDLKPPAA
jgi:hypothetical protein